KHDNRVFHETPHLPDDEPGSTSPWGPANLAIERFYRSDAPYAGAADARGTLGRMLAKLTRDGLLLFLARFIRLFSYGALSVVLVFYLTGLGLHESETGILLTMTLLGDTVVSLWLTTRADRIGRRRMLIVGAILMAGAGLTFAFTHNYFLLIVAGT